MKLFRKLILPFLFLQWLSKKKKKKSQWEVGNFFKIMLITNDKNRMDRVHDFDPYHQNGSMNLVTHI